MDPAAHGTICRNSEFRNSVSMEAQNSREFCKESLLLYIIYILYIIIYFIFNLCMTAKKTELLNSEFWLTFECVFSSIKTGVNSDFADFQHENGIFPPKTAKNLEIP